MPTSSSPSPDRTRRVPWRRRKRLGDGLERRRASGPAIGRVKPAIDERREAGDPRPEVVVDRDPAAAGASARSARSRPCPSSRRRRGRTAAGASPARSRSAPARRPAARGRGCRRAAGGRRSRPRGSRRRRRSTTPRPAVVGEQPLPALDVAGEAEDELRGRRDLDRDRAVHAAIRPAPSRSIARRARSLRFRRSASSRVSQEQASVVPSCSSRSWPPVTRTS